METPKCQSCKQFNSCEVIGNLQRRIHFLMDEETKEQLIQQIMDLMAPICTGYAEKG